MAELQRPVGNHDGISAARLGQSVCRLGIEADFMRPGSDGIEPVREAMDAALDQLNAIRAELWAAVVGA